MICLILFVRHHVFAIMLVSFLDVFTSVMLKHVPRRYAARIAAYKIGLMEVVVFL